MAEFVLIRHSNGGAHPGCSEIQVLADKHSRGITGPRLGGLTGSNAFDSCHLSASSLVSFQEGERR